MIHPLNTISGALVGDMGPSLALVQGQPDSPFGDILGYVIVFFVVIWPIIRGLLGNASEQKKKHEEQQRRSGGRPRPKDAPGRSRLDAFIEDMVSGQRARGDMGDAEAQVGTELPTAARTPLERAVTVVEAPPPVPRRAMPHAQKPTTRLAPVLRPELASETAFNTSLGGDPFDDSWMGRELVSESALTHLRSEDEAETSVAYASAIDRLALSESATAMTVTGDVRESALESIHRGRTPWQAAFVLKEILGPPGGLRSSSDPYR